MDELEVSKTLPQLTSKQATERTKQNVRSGSAAAIGLYLFVQQGGLQAMKTTMANYCSDVYGVDVRTGQYWLTRVQASMILNDMTDEIGRAHV